MKRIILFLFLVYCNCSYGQSFALNQEVKKLEALKAKVASEEDKLISFQREYQRYYEEYQKLKLQYNQDKIFAAESVQLSAANTEYQINIRKENIRSLQYQKIMSIILLFLWV